MKNALLGAQMLFVAFGALVLVPILTGLDANVALFTAGLGTLIFQVITKRTVPVFLASSFAFIPAIIYGVNQWGIPSTMCGLFAAGVLYALLSALVAIRGNDIIHRLLPPVVVGPVIVVIGLGLAPVAVNMALGKTGDGAAVLVPMNQALMVAIPALITTILVATAGHGLLRLLPVMAGLVVGYVISLFLGIVDFSGVANAAWFAMPNFVTPEWNWEAVLYILPVAIAPAVEHVGDMVAISNTANKDYLEKPGLKKTLLGDGLATSAAALLGGPPNTTYSEVTGAVALTKAFNPVIMTWAAGFAILLSFIGKTGALLASIPVPVMGGIMTLLFGTICTVGIGTMTKAKVDLTDSRNMVIVAITLVFGLGGMFLQIGTFQLQGIALSALVAILLNLVLPKTKAV
ncbi:uracil-xanthine permease family protein [Reinekea marinisedimentorum]|uniref:Uracil permease n=1 Tax=Reinekea marinisedimentorum TaxID=230495 RepID=A0A4R3ICA8_9GAMM|nr:uracil-xanthine permease family protein [Reinekea marinisedimentorum]TCS43196.1 uracil permease [Reinekea marinisedimentorum]